MRGAPSRYTAAPMIANFATDGLCTHEGVHLSDGIVMDDTIECPKHNGLFNYMTGEAMGAPVCIDLKIYPTKVENGKVFLLIR
jgi:3-phenylpropionate/trans-cinnamate dioxygenase ferredoxin subunit